MALSAQINYIVPSKSMLQLINEITEKVNILHVEKMQNKTIKINNSKSDLCMGNPLTLKTSQQLSSQPIS